MGLQHTTKKRHVNVHIIVFSFFFPPLFLSLGEFFLFYEPQKDYWGFLTPMTVPRIQGLAAVYKNSIYYIAGTCGNHQRMFTVEAYDIELNKWTRKKDFPCDESINPYLKLVLFQNKLHLFVRATQVTVEEHVFRTSRKNSLYQYDDITDQWMKVYETPDRSVSEISVLFGFGSVPYCFEPCSFTKILSY